MTEGTERGRGLAREFGRALEVLLPPPCVLCGRATSPGSAPVCQVCFVRLPRMDPPRCGRCGATRVVRLPATGTCHECARWPPHLVRAAAPYRMEEGASRLVRALKFDRCFTLAPRMGRSMARAARSVAGGRPHLLVPVPLARARLRERGFNQAELLTRSLAEALGWPWSPLLERRRGGRPQARLGVRDRSANVRGAFRVRRAAEVPELPPLLVDDVVTTGATAAACAATLADSGAAPAGVVTFARALRPVAAP